MEMTLTEGTLLQGGKYRIARVLGQGGFGITYEAEQVNLGRTVAVKEFFMKDSCGRDETSAAVTMPTTGARALVEKFRGKFIREAQMIAGMKHPRVVRVTDVFEENGTAYYVMDYLPGGSLAGKVKAEGKLSESQAVTYIRQVADALGYIHSKNTLHLDVKPANILLDEEGQAVLVDFGVSKHYDEAGEQTSSTPVALSAGYAPIEQSKAGDVAKMQPATDIYALGATLYNMVTGQIPPDAADVYEEGLARPEGLSDGLWAAIEAAMQPRRKDRPQSVAAFLSLLPKDSPDKPGNDGGKETVIPSASPVIPSEVEESMPRHSTAPSVESAETTIIHGGKDSKKAPKKKDDKKPNRKALYYGLAAAAFLVAFVLIFGISRGNGMKEASPSVPADTVIATPITEEVAVECVEPVPAQQNTQKQPHLQQSTTQQAQTTAPITGSSNGHEWVDLGLPSGTKWATCNVGASSPSDYGDYYAWAETKTKLEYTWETLKYWKYRTSTTGDHFIKYVPSDELRYWSGSGSPDNKRRLDLSDDAAKANWGEAWHIPSKSQWEELVTNCTWAWTTQNGVNGRLVTSKANGNSIFLPAAGWQYGSSPSRQGSIGRYWSSSLNDAACAWCLDFRSGSHFGGLGSEALDFRCHGLSIRPVTE